MQDSGQGGGDKKDEVTGRLSGNPPSLGKEMWTASGRGQGE